MIDVYAFTGHWPFRAVPDERAPLRWMDRAGIRRALVTPMDALFRLEALETARDVAHLAKRHPDRVSAVFPVNPTIAGWQGRLGKLCERTAPAALALMPGYHAYDATDACVDALLDEATRRGLPVLVVLRVEDVRKQHPLMPVPDVPIEPVTALARRHADAPLVLLGATAPECALLADLPNVYVEISGMEGVDPPAAAVEALGPERVLLGTRAPFFVPESSRNKLAFSALDASVVRMITSENANRLFKFDA